MKVIYQNTRAARVRFLQILLWVCALGVPALLYGQVEAGSQDDAILMAILAPTLILLALAMEGYLRCYVMCLVDMPDGVSVETMSTFGRASRLVDWSDMKPGCDLHDTFFGGDAPSVDNTATLLRLEGRRLPLIIDTTKDTADLSKLRRSYTK